jgi:hypothetical protein
MESSNNIIHPTRLKGLAFGSSCLGRVMISVGPTSEALKAVRIQTFHFVQHMPYQVYKTNSANWNLITIDEIGLEAAQQAIGDQNGPFVFWKAISTLGGIGMDVAEDVKHNLEAQGYHMQNSKIEITESKA